MGIGKLWRSSFFVVASNVRKKTRRFSIGKRVRAQRRCEGFWSTSGLGKGESFPVPFSGRKGERKRSLEGAFH